VSDTPKKSAFGRDLIIVSALSALSAWLIATMGLDRAVPLSFWLSLAFIIAATVAIHIILVRANKKRPQIFVAYFMGALAVKIFLSAILLLAIGYFNPASLKFTAIGFFVVYALLTAVELRHLLPLVRRSSL
jgi:FtsH-binding integral membrane protein